MPKEFPDSLPGFQKMFPAEGNCASYLEDVRWPDGFVCPSCGVVDEPQHIATRPTVLRCRSCSKETSLTAGTIMHRSHTPLCTWFWGAYLVTTLTPGISATQFQRQLGLTRYETAFQILHKLRAGMVRPDRDKIGEKWPVEVDETYVGGQTRGEGAGVHHMQLVAGAVEVRREWNPVTKAEKKRGGKPIKGKTWVGRLRLHVTDSRTKIDLEGFVENNIREGATVITDGWQGYEDIEELGYVHTPFVLGGDPKLAEKYLPMIHLVFSNLKTWLQGTHHGVSTQHLQAYLNEFVFRFNRRFEPMSAFNSVLGIGVAVESPTYDELYSGAWVHPNPED